MQDQDVADKNKRTYLQKRVSSMAVEYQSFEAHYKDISEFFEPRRGRFDVFDRNKGEKRHKSIINNAGTKALRVATAGLLAGAMSPSRPWFRYSTHTDPDLRDHEASKQWIDLFEKVIRAVLNASNLYNMAPTMLKELLMFGTAAMYHVDDFQDVARFYTHSVGSFYIGLDERLNVNQFARKFQMHPTQMIARFGMDNVSQAVKDQYNRGNYMSWHNVYHLIEPNSFYSPKSILAERKPYRSVFFEPGNGEDDEQMLKVEGFKGFPMYVPRWEVTAEDIYATNCPGITALGDVKQLQTQEKEKAKAQAKQHNPPLKGPPSLRNQRIPNLPGGVTLYTQHGSGEGLSPVYMVDPRIQEMMLDIQQTERRIQDAFFNDLFLAITNMAGIQPKNELQLSQVNEERLLQMGPVLQQIHGEWLHRMVTRVAEQILDAGIMPEAPKELQGKELELEFISALAMAQRAVATGAIERTVGFAGVLTQSGYDTTMKINGDKALEEYADLVGAPPTILVPDEEVAERRRQQQEQIEAAQNAERANQMANVAKTAADAKLDNANVLSAAMGRS